MHTTTLNSGSSHTSGISNCTLTSTSCPRAPRWSSEGGGESSDPTLSLSVIKPPERPCWFRAAQRCGTRLIPWAALLIFGLTVAILALGFGLFGGCGLLHPCRVQPGLAGYWSPEDDARVAHWSVLMFTAATLLLAPGAMWLLIGAPTFHMRCVAGYATTVWAAVWMRTLEQMLVCGVERASSSEEMATSPLKLIGDIFFSLIAVFYCVLLFARLRALSRSAELPGIRRLRCVLLSLMATWLVGISTWLLLNSNLLEEGAMRLLVSVPAGLGMLLYLAYCVLALRLLCVARGLALSAAASPSDHQASEARHAASTLRVQGLGVALGTATSAVSFITFLLRWGVLWPIPAICQTDLAPSVYLAVVLWPSVLDPLANGFSALALSGSLTGAMDAGAVARRTRKQRQQRWSKFVAEWRPSWHERSGGRLDSRWKGKVQELAGRGVTLEALLRFYRGLGSSYMAHYDASVHTTNDVVRQAIIPLSCKDRQALATIMMQGRYTRPQRMVTHSWSNLFRDLLAAIVADALEESEYGDIAELLERDVGRLEELVRHRGMEKRTYWVCAFAVNQHLGICHQPYSVDSATGDPFPQCSCGLPKALNDSPPGLPDGRSIPCEMNKFEDMMRALASTDRNFEQVIAVGANFALFTRAWCVAEIATADSAGMCQSLKLQSAKGVEEQEQRLRALKIQDMAASRAEDKEAILASIPDVDKFNARLQQLLFQDLLPAWQDLDAWQKMVRAGHVICWQQLVVG